MDATLLSLTFDVFVMVALIFTIYYAMRLSKSLDNFRNHRNEMKTLVAELANNINSAQKAIDGLKATSDIAADNLDDVLNDAKRMREELMLGKGFAFPDLLRAPSSHHLGDKREIVPKFHIIWNLRLYAPSYDASRRS